MGAQRAHLLVGGRQQRVQVGACVAQCLLPQGAHVCGQEGCAGKAWVLKRQQGARAVAKQSCKLC